MCERDPSSAINIISNIMLLSSPQGQTTWIWVNWFCLYIAISQAIVFHDTLNPIVALLIKFMIEFFQLLIGIPLSFTIRHFFLKKDEEWILDKVHNHNHSVSPINIGWIDHFSYEHAYLRHSQGKSSWANEMMYCGIKQWALPSSTFAMHALWSKEPFMSLS